MVRGGEISTKRKYKRRVVSEGNNGSDDSDEDYVIPDEENEVSACSEEEEYCSSADGFSSEAVEERKVRKKVKKASRSKKPKRRYGNFKEEEEDEDEDEDEYENEDEDEDYNENEDEDEELTEEVKTEGRSEVQRGLCSEKKNGVKQSQKKRRVGYMEEDDDEFMPSNNEDEDEELMDELEMEGRSNVQRVLCNVQKNKVEQSQKKRRVGCKEEDDEEFTPSNNEDEDVEDEDEDEEEDEDEDEELEELETEGRSKVQRGFCSALKNEVKPSQKKRRVGCKEDDEEFMPSNNEEEEDDDDDDDDDDDFTADEDDSLDEEESRVKRKKISKKAGKRVLQKKSLRGRKKRKRSMASKKPTRKKARKACGFRRKARSDDDNDFIDNEVVLPEQGEMKRGPKKRRFVVDSDSDFAPSASCDYEYTVSEEEREQVREANEFCRSRIDLTSSSVPEKVQEGVLLQLERKKIKGRKGKEKVEEEVKAEVAKKVCGICLSEEDKRRVRGTINCCAHYFCFTCISEWAKVESRCPLCKQRFNTISKRARSSAIVDQRVVTIEVPERDQVYQPTEEELRSYLYPYEDVICSECHLGGHDDLMLLCDECDSSAHTFCVGLGHEVPEGSWFCHDCKPLDPESPSSPAQTHLFDQRPSINTSTVRASSVTNNHTVEGFDLNLVSLQGLGSLPSPRNQFGGFQATTPLAGAGASTLSGRIRLRHQIHHCLSERPDRHEGNFMNPQLDQARETAIQRESAQLFEERFCENHSPVVRETDLFPPNLRGTGQDPNSPVLSGFANGGSLWPGHEERNSLLEQPLRQCNGGSNNGHERQEVDFHTAKEQLQLMVKTHLKNLSRGSDLAQSKLEEIAKCSIQAILVACELEHWGNEVAVVPVSPPPTCDHIELTSVSKASLMRGCCSLCFDSYVGDVVKKILDAKLTEEQKWLCLALAL